jgi:hypothetical protein
LPRVVGRISEPRPHWIDHLRVSFDSEVRKRGVPQNDACFDTRFARACCGT